MAKWYGVVGYSETSETSPGVWEPKVTEKECFGDFVRNTRRIDSASQVNDNVTISNELSIVADPYALENFHSIRYASYQKTLWKVTSVEVQFPRLILQLGEVYNGPTPETS